MTTLAQAVRSARDARDARIAGLVADGHTDPSIAEALGVSASTVRTRVQRCGGSGWRGADERG